MRPAQPPLHACPDCGAKHATPDDYAAHQQRLNEHFRICLHCRSMCIDGFVVRGEVWQAAGLDYHAGVIHLECLEAIIGRRLKPADFADLPANEVVRYFFKRFNVL